MYTPLEGKVLVCKEVDGSYWVEVILPSTQRMGVITDEPFKIGSKIEALIDFEEMVIRSVRYPTGEPEEPGNEPVELDGFDPDGLDDEDGAVGQVL